MDARTTSDGALVAVLHEALAPYSWRRFTPALLARFALAARDRQELTAGLAALQGAALGSWERLQPADRSDPRVPWSVGLLSDLRLADASLLTTCRNLAAASAPEPR